MVKYNRFEAIAKARKFARDLKEKDPTKDAEALTAIAKRTSAIYELNSEIVKSIDTSRFRRIADKAKESFVLRKLLGGDGKGLNKVSDYFDGLEMTYSTLHKLADAFSKDPELSKATISCVNRHAANIVNAICDIAERKDFENPHSFFEDKDDFEELRKEAKNVMRNSEEMSEGYVVLSKAYHGKELKRLFDELKKEIREEKEEEKKEKTTAE